MLTATSVMAANTPYGPELEARLNKIENLQTVKIPVDCNSGGCTVTAHATGFLLPANATIIRSYIYVKEQLYDAGSGTIAVSCEDANNIKTATDLTGTSSGGYIEGASTGAASAFVGSIAATCDITYTIGTVAPNAGFFDVYVTYVTTD